MVRFRGDRRGFGNGVLLLLGLLCVGGALVSSGAESSGPQVLVLLVLGLGLALLVPYVLLVVAFAARWVVLGTVLVAVVLVASYLGFLLVAFLLYSLVYGWTTRAEGAIAIVVHGSGLLGGRVSPLLASRLDRALGLWRADRPLLPAERIAARGCRRPGRTQVVHHRRLRDSGGTAARGGGRRVMAGESKIGVTWNTT
ncbi:hypothetical protein [Nocardia mangyaensis]|uniref:hypothetical protein n=1 Tax=Nocardia mangyaensis TaxID=2213200 RepID=UPI0012EBDF58|nr:hypothetical protein [Nocardia mangyaensis]